MLKMKISARGIRKSFNMDTSDTVLAIDNISLDIAEGEFVALLGPSGCGKSTFLNIVGGFDKPTAGNCLLNNQEIMAPGADRGVVFQDYALFPWKRVSANIAYGLKIAGKSKKEQDTRVAELIEMMGLGGFENTYPEFLSGGMKQRVAIARALSYDPEVLLMDEPFGALDAQTRSRMIDDLNRIHHTMRKTVLFVTHSVEEALLLSDKVVLFSARPSQIKQIYEIDLPHPRLATAPAFVEYERAILANLQEEEFCDKATDAA